MLSETSITLETVVKNLFGVIAAARVAGILKTRGTIQWLAIAGSLDAFLPGHMKRYAFVVSDRVRQCGTQRSAYGRQNIYEPPGMLEKILTIKTELFLLIPVDILDPDVPVIDAEVSLFVAIEFQNWLLKELPSKVSSAGLLRGASTTMPSQVIIASFPLQ